MTISARQVKELRDLSGAGMMECKSALVEADGDISIAQDGSAAQARPVERR
jgi:elongation factor Ts